MTRDPIHSYRSEISAWAMARARRRGIQPYRQAAPVDQEPCPSWCDITIFHRHVEERWPVHKTLGVSIFAVLFIYALVIVTAAAAVAA